MSSGRKRAVNGKGWQEKKHARASETYKKEMAVLQHFQSVGDDSKTLDKYYAHLTPSKRETQRKAIYAWRKQRSEIKKMCELSTTASQRTKRAKGTAIVLSREEEETVKLWINSVSSEGVPASALMLQLKARSVAQVEGVPAELFTASWSWRKAFLQRHGLSFRARTRQGQRTPPDMKTAATAF